MGVAVADAGREAALAQQATLRCRSDCTDRQIAFFSIPRGMAECSLKGMTRTISYTRSRHQEEA